MISRWNRKAGCLLGLLLVLQLGRAGVTAAETLSFAAATVTLHGHLRVKTFPGRPNFESLKEGDEPERQWVLELNRPMSVQPAPNDDYNYAVKDVILVTLAPPLGSKAWPILKRSKNKTVSVSGKLECASPSSSYRSHPERRRSRRGMKKRSPSSGGTEADSIAVPG